MKRKITIILTMCMVVMMCMISDSKIKAANYTQNMSSFYVEYNGAFKAKYKVTPVLTVEASTGKIVKSTANISRVSQSGTPAGVSTICIYDAVTSSNKYSATYTVTIYRTVLDVRSGALVSKTAKVSSPGIK